MGKNTGGSQPSPPHADFKFAILLSAKTSPREGRLRMSKLVRLSRVYTRPYTDTSTRMNEPRWADRSARTKTVQRLWNWYELCVPRNTGRKADFVTEDFPLVTSESIKMVQIYTRENVNKASECVTSNSKPTLQGGVHHETCTCVTASEPISD